MQRSHHTDYQDVVEAVIAFSECCRSVNLAVGINHTQEALIAVEAGFIGDENSFRYALRALFCVGEEEHGVFDKVFRQFWGKRKGAITSKRSLKNQTKLSKPTKGSVVMMGFGDTLTAEEEEAKNVSGANKVQALRKTDFSKIRDIDSQLLDELAEKLLKQMSHRLKRRLQSSKRGTVDIRNTIRKNLSNGGNFFELERKNRRIEKYRLIVLLDVSGSMDKYSFYLLKFIWSLKSNFKDIEAFVFSTKLIRITDYIDKSQLEYTLHLMSQNTDNWSSGTNIGACLADFNDQYAKRALNGKSMTIVLSDGLDTGEPDFLAAQLHRIKMRTNKVVWLNPLKGMEGYQPLAKGMKAALPEINTFESAHNLDSLLKLEKILTYV